MNAFTRGNIAAAERHLSRCIEALENVCRGGDLQALHELVHQALSRAQGAKNELERAVRLEEQTEGGDAG